MRPPLERTLLVLLCVALALPLAAHAWAGMASRYVVGDDYRAGHIFRDEGLLGASSSSPRCRTHREDWSNLSVANLARAYGADEPEYEHLSGGQREDQPGQSSQPSTA